MKNNIIAKQRIGILLGIFIIAISCSDDILEQTNPNAVTPSSFWKSEEDATKGILGAYSPFTNIWYYTRFEIFTSDYRDDVVNGYGTSERTAVGYFSGTSETNGTFWVWSAMFQGVTRANEVLWNVPNIDMDATRKDNILGEAYFIRAFNYFNLLNSWRNVPLILTPIGQIENPNTILQAPPEEVWAQIESDLTNAQQMLPPSWDSDNLGRATSGAATGLLGKVFLYQQKYAQAKTEFTKVMGGSYQLMDNYADNFREATENNAESLFEIQLIADGNSGWGGDSPGLGKGTAFQPDLAPAGFTNQDGMRVNNWVLDLYRDEQTLGGELDPRTYTTLFFNSAETTQYEGQTLSSKTYGGASYLETYPDGGDIVYGNKFLDWEDGGYESASAGGWYDSGNNLRILRYADVLLMFAEAEFMLSGSTASALDAINQVRARADLASLTSITMKDIEDERVKELSLERTRYFDLLRWDKVKSRIVDNPEFKNESTGTDAYKPGREYIAIPQNEMDGNPNFIQNPGY